ncbi:BaiN/RdsA family NAD(P)/FAD-dependent oxidoreductase [Oceanivirga miroungae]|uniref:Anaerobic glycerol-3-phosphate dehydrogenase subunit B n=1 Tax=Oceanivirga miroungae TaxID=1130046 RepID=A0A6I8M821_9FUSO|nr:aminoacetone oxidase family FAD-binding enzyme [Oceanivirga miroungae]VWL85661.1 Anaerobic glycerol-3-phosphate dehydrogenase subunit B [Oceanivirga miroungae]
MVYDYIIIGGGASGCILAIELLKKGKKVLIIEHKDRILKKLLVTGNGRCNFTNINATKDNYYGNNKLLIENTMKNYPPERIIEYFSNLGILHKELKNGKVYPNSLQASSVVDAIRNMLSYLACDIVYNTEINSCYKSKDIFYVNEYKAYKLVIATGGNSYKELGSDGSGYEIAKSFSHSITSLEPVLVQLKTDPIYIKGLEGIKQDVTLKVYDNNKLLRVEKDEILFTSYGISGPVIFNSSYLTALHGFSIEFSIDFLEEYTHTKLLEFLKDRVNKLYFLEATEFLNGILHKKLGMFLLKKSGLEKLNVLVCEISDKILENLVKNIKDYRIKAYDTTGFKNAQVTKGGVDSNELTLNFESKIHENLYFIGEIVDIFGDCGGYNLQFNFASSLTVGGLDD